jgi:hypothetical protein
MGCGGSTGERRPSLGKPEGFELLRAFALLT